MGEAMKKALSALLFVVSFPLHANSLDAEHIGCSGYNNQYILNWTGDWFGAELIYLEWDDLGTNYQWYDGYLPHCGTDSSPIHKAWYRMVGEFQGGWLAMDSAHVPIEPCEPVD
jgi:hypothetical protein